MRVVAVGTEGLLDGACQWYPEAMEALLDAGAVAQLTSLLIERKLPGEPLVIRARWYEELLKTLSVLTCSRHALDKQARDMRGGAGGTKGWLAFVEAGGVSLTYLDESASDTAFDDTDLGKSANQAATRLPIKEMMCEQLLAM